jgi:adenine deaminase
MIHGNGFRLPLALACGLLLPVLPLAQSKPAADLIITNATVWTVDKSLPKAQAVAVLGDRIVSVGSIDELEGWRGPRTRVIDARGKLLCRDLTMPTYILLLVECS